jgi:uncharacterized zinc-type alcohol dehydrogenase-like protein
MATSRVTGYAAKAVGQPLEPFTYDPPKIGEHDISVAVTHCGLCYTDIQGIDDYYGITTYPFVPGHEIVGFVSEVGKATSGLKKGDRVGIGWQGRSCGQCEWCKQGEEQLCIDIVKDAAWEPHGGFSTSIVVDSRFAYPLPDKMPSEVASVFMCGGISVFSPLNKYAKQGSQKIGIIGVGGLGHLAIQFARALGYDVTVISTSAEKKQQAMAFGADNFIVSNDRDGLRKLEFVFDFLLSTAHGDVQWEPLLEIVKKRGKLVLVGFPDMHFNPTDLIAHELSMTGSFLGNRATMKEMLSFAQAHDIKPWIELMPMSRINEAIQRVKENKARYRIVLVNEK